MGRNAALAITLLAVAGLSAGCTSAGSGRWNPLRSCQDITLPVYFQEKSDALTPPAQQALIMAAEKARACRVTGVEVLGLYDIRDASPELSQLRAEAVSGALIAQGLNVPRADAIGAAPRARDGRSEPMQRRTEVVIRLDR